MNLHKTLMPLWLCLILLLASCSKELTRSEYTHVIPADATEIASLALSDLAQKAGLDRPEQAGLRAQVLALLTDQASASLTAQIEKLMEQPEEAGLDFQSPAYVFHAPKLHTVAATLKVSDLKKWEALVELLVKEKLLTSPIDRKGYRTTDIASGNLRLAYNDGTLLVLWGNSRAELDKRQAAIDALMNQSAEKSAVGQKNFTQMKDEKGDIRLLMTPDALPFNLRGILSWPQGTQLVGYLQFENGRLYAQVRQADFTGETHESNQPFHPKSYAELQAAMSAMMRGASYNVELTTEELLTLTNLRALMQFSPDEPEIQSLYNLIQQIETINLRGDSRCTRFTLVLANKRVNSLQQALELAQGMLGMM